MYIFLYLFLNIYICIGQKLNNKNKNKHKLRQSLIIARPFEFPCRIYNEWHICKKNRVSTLSDRLSDWYGISGQAQIWFSSYLQNRLQSVKIKDTFSDKVTLSYGVPQGSVLGRVLFTLYTTPLSAIISSFDINHHLYADDTQIYMSLSVSNAKESLEKLQHCLMGDRI